MIPPNDFLALIQKHLLQQQQQIPMPLSEITRFMVLSDDLVGCIIGRGGTKINSIRQESGAQIKIANAEEGSPHRKITIRGSPESVRTAVEKIEYTVTLHKRIVLMNRIMDLRESGAIPNDIDPNISLASTFSNSL